jgi:tetratricopeptide (TPR) repeat protein
MALRPSAQPPRGVIIPGMSRTRSEPTVNVPALAQARRQYELALADISADLGWAALHCGRLLHLSGDLPGAREAFRASIIAANPEHAPVAALHLGRLSEELGDADAAAAAYLEAMASGDPKHAAAAAYRLGGLLQAGGDIEGARAAFEQAAGSKNPWYARLAAAALSMLG